MKVIPAFALAVVIVSFISTPEWIELGTNTFCLFISVGPVCSVTSPTPALLMVGFDSNSVARTINCSVNF